MGRHKTGKPDGATEITTYSELEELISNFVEQKIGLLAVVGNPGLAKSQSIRRAIEGKVRPKKRRQAKPSKRPAATKKKTAKPKAPKPKLESPPPGRPCLYIKGRKSGIDLYCDIYTHAGEPIIIDDPDDLLRQSQTLGLLKDLCETDQFKRMYWGTATAILGRRGVPNQFTTTSHCCLIANYWGNDAFFKALESRAEFVYFNPSWAEVYRAVGEWFSDQEIYDYVWSKMEYLKQPDVRIVVKAAARKRAGMEHMPWQRLIDDYCDDKPGMVIRQIMNDPVFPNEAAREDYFKKETGMDRTTYYRRKKEIQSYCPTKKPKRIILPNADRVQLATAK